MKTKTPLPAADIHEETEATRRFLGQTYIDTRSDEYLKIFYNANKDVFRLQVVCRLPYDNRQPEDDRREVDSSGRILAIARNFYPSYSSLEWFEEFPEQSPVRIDKITQRDQIWVTATNIAALKIRRAWPEEKLLFNSEAARQRYQSILLEHVTLTLRAKMQSEFKLNGKVPHGSKHIVEHPDLPASDYQKVAANFGLHYTGTGYFMEPGTGKTFIGIQLFCAYGGMKTGRINLVVCPNAVRYNWSREIRKFTTAKCRVAILRGTQQQRFQKLMWALSGKSEVDFTTIIVSYDTLTRDIENLSLIPWDLVVADESHYFKSPTAKRFKAMERIRDVSKQRIILTGTPIGNSPLDIWTQLEFLDKGASGFFRFKGFRDFHSIYEERGQAATGGSAVAIVGFKEIPTLQERLSQYAFQITKEQANLGLPDKVYDVLEVEMTKEQLQAYKDMRDTLKVEIGEYMDKSYSHGEKATTDHILTMLLRLAQITSGHIKIDPVFDDNTGVQVKEGFIKRFNSRSPKIEKILEEVQTMAPNEKCIIWANFREDIERLQARFDEAGIGAVTYYGGTKDTDKLKAEDAYNCDPNIKVLIGHQASAGVGLNLLGYDYRKFKKENAETHTARMFRMSSNWSFLQAAQAEDRAHRRGMKDSPLRITNIICPSENGTQTIDEIMLERVESKKKGAEALLDITDVLKEVIGINMGVLT